MIIETDEGFVTIDLSPDQTAYISRIEVTGERAVGNGSRLLSLALEALKSQRYASVTAYVNHGNFPSQRLFQKMGFAPYPSEAWDAQYGDYWRKDLA